MPSLVGRLRDRDGAQRRHLDRRLQRVAGDAARDAAQCEQADRGGADPQAARRQWAGFIWSVMAISFMVAMTAF